MLIQIDERHAGGVTILAVSGRITMLDVSGQLKERVAKTIEYLKGMKPGDIDGTEDKDISITFPNGNTRQFKGQGLLLGNSLPNFYFHATTAYDIVRQCGVEIGKRDFMGNP